MRESVCFPGTKTVYAYTSSLEESDLLLCAKRAAESLKSHSKNISFSFDPCQEYKIPCEVPFSQVLHSQRISLLKDADAAARASSGSISQVICRYLDVMQNVQICNSEGVFALDSRPRARLMVQAVASDGTDYQSGSNNPGAGKGYETFRSIDASGVGREAARIALVSLKAPACPAGYVPAVLDGGFGGVIFHEACGHSLEATSVSKGNSEFCGKLNTKVASEKVTAVDDGTLPGEWGSLSVDDEGTPTRRNVLIENGILKSYMIDRLGSLRMGLTVTGNSRRQSYKFAPTSRMTNTFLCGGNDSFEEMISTMGEGLYAKSLGGGSVNPTTGEFNFTVLEGYWVRDGHILCPVRGATLVGKGTEVLKNIDRIGPSPWLGQGMCGSISGSLPVNVGQPHIRLSEITVGGKGGSL